MLVWFHSWIYLILVNSNCNHNAVTNLYALKITVVCAVLVLWLLGSSYSSASMLTSLLAIDCLTTHTFLQYVCKDILQMKYIFSKRNLWDMHPVNLLQICKLSVTKLIMCQGRINCYCISLNVYHIKRCWLNLLVYNIDFVQRPISCKTGVMLCNKVNIL